MVEKITKDFLSKILNEIKKEENQQCLEIELLNPVLLKFGKKCYPYIKIILIIFIIHFILIIAILALIVHISLQSFYKT